MPCNNNINHVGGLKLKKLIWKLFRKTGNIETYLLLKQMENDHPLENVVNYSETPKQKIKSKK